MVISPTDRLSLTCLRLDITSLFKVGLAQEGGPVKEVYNVTAIWLRVLATTHQEDVTQVTMLVQQWFNMFGRWPITIAFFASCAPTGDAPGAADVPAGLKGDVFEAAMWFKAYLTELAKIHYALPMVPVFWEVCFTGARVFTVVWSFLACPYLKLINLAPPHRIILHCGSHYQEYVQNHLITSNNRVERHVGSIPSADPSHEPPNTAESSGQSELPQISISTIQRLIPLAVGVTCS